MGRYAENTEVSQEKSRAEIESILRKYGAAGFSYGWEDARAVVAFKANDRHVRFEITLPDRNSTEFTEYQRGIYTHYRTDTEAQKRWEQAGRQRWRALTLVIKAKLEAVDAGISVFEEEFLANIVLPDGKTVGDHIRPAIEQAYADGKMPKLLLTSGPQETA